VPFVILCRRHLGNHAPIHRPLRHRSLSKGHNVTGGSHGLAAGGISNLGISEHREPGSHCFQSTKRNGGRPSEAPDRWRFLKAGASHRHLLRAARPWEPAVTLLQVVVRPPSSKVSDRPWISQRLRNNVTTGTPADRLGSCSAHNDTRVVLAMTTGLVFRPQQVHRPHYTMFIASTIPLSSSSFYIYG